MNREKDRLKTAKQINLEAGMGDAELLKAGSLPHITTDKVFTRQDLESAVKLRDQQWIEEIERVFIKTKDRGIPYLFMSVGSWGEIKSKMETK